MRIWTALAALTLSYSVPGGARSADMHSIAVTHRFSSMACAGVCLDSDLVVRSDGIVTYRVARAATDQWKKYRYRISQEQVQKFWRIYEEIRPTGLKGPVGDCNEYTLVIDLDIRWDGSEHPSRLLACHGVEGVRQAYWSGFRILKFSPVTGRRLSAEAAESFR